MEIKFKKLVPEAKTPLKAYEYDAGFDLYAISIEKKDKYIEYKTGIAFEIPKGYVGLVFPRSSITKYDLMLKNSVGVIDSGYLGEILCRFHNTIEDDSTIKIQYGSFWDEIKNPYPMNKLYEVDDRIVQIIFLKLPEISLVETEEFDKTERGEDGFGSTGLK